MFSSWPFPSSRSRFALVVGFLVGIVGCRNDAPSDPRFDDPALRRPNDSKKLTVVFVDGVPVPVESADSFAAARTVKTTPAKPTAVRAEISWQVPDGWTSEPPSSQVRLAEYRVPATEPNGTPAQVGVFYLGPSDTAIDDTLQRWASSFDEASAKGAKRAMRRGGAYPTHFVEVSGTYNVSPMMSPEGEDAGAPTRPGWMLLGAIVETPMGPYYFKFLGPKEVVEGGREPFVKMIDSVGRGPGSPASPSSAASPGSAAPVRR